MLKYIKKNKINIKLFVIIILFFSINSLISISLVSSATVRTANFIVETSDPAFAQQVAQAAEKYRHDLAIEWLGKAMPNWGQPCVLTVQAGPGLGAGGATTFVFDRGEVFGWRMSIQGSAERILDSVLPHEITHMILASHFRQPVPRWADEGAATSVEHISEKNKHRAMLDQFLRTGRGIAFSQMFAMTEYPKDIMPLYAQGYSLAEFLIQTGGRRKFVEFLGDGLCKDDWAGAVSRHYGVKDLSALQNTWLLSVQGNGKKCTKDSDCGTETPGEKYCFNGGGQNTDLYQKFKVPKCNLNTGQCTQAIEERKIQDCGKSTPVNLGPYNCYKDNKGEYMGKLGSGTARGCIQGSGPLNSACADNSFSKVVDIKYCIGDKNKCLNIADSSGKIIDSVCVKCMSDSDCISNPNFGSGYYCDTYQINPTNPSYTCIAKEGSAHKACSGIDKGKVDSGFCEGNNVCDGEGNCVENDCEKNLNICTSKEVCNYPKCTITITMYTITGCGYCKILNTAIESFYRGYKGAVCYQYTNLDKGVPNQPLADAINANGGYPYVVISIIGSSGTVAPGWKGKTDANTMISYINGKLKELNGKGLKKCVENNYPVKNTVGQSSSASSFSIYMTRDKNNFTLNGMAYVINPHLILNENATVTLKSYDETQYETYKYDNHESILDACDNKTFIRNITEEIGVFGGEIDLNREIIIDIPAGAIFDETNITISKYNLSECYLIDNSIDDCTAKSCTSSNDCKLSSCNSITGSCDETNKPDGTSCALSSEVSSLSPFLSFLKLFGITISSQGQGSCINGVCVSNGCTPQCSGKQCGDDGCGNPNGCGTCSVGSSCNLNGQCIIGTTVGTTTIGLYEQSTSTFFLRNSNTNGYADITFLYGAANVGLTSIAGDWDGDGKTTIGLYDPSTATFMLRNSNTIGYADLTFLYGVAWAGLLPIAGDWDGDGKTTIGLYDPSTATFMLRNSNNAGYADLTFTYGAANTGLTPIAGDWDGDGKTTIGLYDPSTSTFLLRNTNNAGYADLTFTYGAANTGLIPIAGDWDGDGKTTIGVYDSSTSTFMLRNSNTAGYADITFLYGAAGKGLILIAGDWDGA